MNHPIKTIIFLLWISWIMFPAESNAATEYPAGSGVTADPEYVIGHGDILNIDVWKDDALAKQVTVLPDGRIAFPLIGEITAGGKTVAQLRREIETGLKRFVPDPILNVEVEQVNSMLIYVIGKVNQPGRFILNTNIDILQALAMAGGLNPFAKQDSIKIFRKTDQETSMYHFNYDEVSEGKQLSQNILLKRGDVIVVP
ncbi:MAG: sugar transporter [Desulfobacterium sp.]|nr:sugar transporter [Desulfobacterium sp.]